MADVQDIPNMATKEWVQTLGLVLTAWSIMCFLVPSE